GRIAATRHRRAVRAHRTALRFPAGRLPTGEGSSGGRRTALRLVEDVTLQEREDPVERVAPVLAPLPAVALVVVPVDLVELVLDLERLDHPLRHQRNDALVLAAVEEQQRRLDPLRLIDRGPAPEELRLARIVRLAHLAPE